VQIEFVSANPTGPLHLGHGRGAAVGAALANLLRAAGYRVDREYYINDAGRQVKLLGMSMFAAYQQLLGNEYPLPEDGYKGGYVEDIAREFLKEQGGQYTQERFENVADIFIDFAYLGILSGIKDRKISEYL
jgi:arginyl-tRNA synthetase